MESVNVILWPFKMKGQDLQALFNEGWILENDINYGVNRNCYVMIGSKRVPSNQRVGLQILPIGTIAPHEGLVLIHSDIPFPRNAMEAFLQHYRITYGNISQSTDLHFSIISIASSLQKHFMKDVQLLSFGNAKLSCIDAVQLGFPRRIIHPVIYEIVFRVEGSIQHMWQVIDLFNQIYNQLIIHDSDIFYDSPAKHIVISSPFPPTESITREPIYAPEFHLTYVSSTQMKTPLKMDPIDPIPVVHQVQENQYYSIENIAIGLLDATFQSLQKTLGVDSTTRIQIDENLNRLIIEISEEKVHILEKFVQDQNMDTCSLFLAKCPKPVQNNFILPIYRSLSQIEINLIFEQITSKMNGHNPEYDESTLLFRFTSSSADVLTKTINFLGFQPLKAFSTYPICLILAWEGPESLPIKEIESINKSINIQYYSPFEKLHVLYFLQFQDAKSFINHHSSVRKWETSMFIMKRRNMVLLDLNGHEVNRDTLVTSLQDWSIHERSVFIDPNRSCAVAILSESALVLTSKSSLFVRVPNQDPKQLFVVQYIPMRLIVLNFDPRYWNRHLILEQELNSDRIFSSTKWTVKPGKCTFIISCGSKCLYQELKEVKVTSLSSGEIVTQAYRGVFQLYTYDLQWFLYVYKHKFESLCALRRNLNRVWSSLECNHYLKNWTQHHQDHSPATKRLVEMSVGVTALFDSIGVCLRGCIINPDLTTKNLELVLNLVVLDTTKPIKIKPREENKCKLVLKSAYSFDEYHKLEQESLSPLIMLLSSEAHAESSMRGWRLGHLSDAFICSAFCKKLIPYFSEGQTRSDESAKSSPEPLEYFPRTTIFRHNLQNGFEYLKAPKTVDILRLHHGQPLLSGKSAKDKHAIQELHMEICYALFYAASKNHKSIILCLESHQKKEHTESIFEIFRNAIMLLGSNFKRVTLLLHPSQYVETEMGSWFNGWRSKLSEPIAELLRKDTILSMDICGSGIHCSNNSAEHSNSKSHPFTCPYYDRCTEIKSHLHKIIWDHTRFCPDRGHCMKYDDPEHNKFNKHPPRCQLWEKCSDTSGLHSGSFLHPTICLHGLQCHVDPSDPHWEKYRHLKKTCRHGTFCPQYNDMEHYEEYQHPFLPICSKSISTCGNSSKHHLKSYSHICPAGRYCKDIENHRHLKIFVHIFRPECKFKGDCKNIGDDRHCSLFAHREVKEIRTSCRDGVYCQKRTEFSHIKDYHHSTENYPYCTSKMLNKAIDFAENQKFIESAMSRYKTNISKEIIDWFSGLKPVHRCSIEIFESIVSHGMLMSRDSMGELLHPDYAAKEAMNNPAIRHIIKKNSSDDPQIQSQLIATLESYIYECIMHILSSKKDSHTTYHSTRAEAAKGKLRDHGFKDDQFAKIIDKCKNAAENCHRLKENLMGIGYVVDQEMGTSSHVFSILGPHMGAYYGAISIVLKQEILYHPDSNFTCCAATSFHSRKAMIDRPWIQMDGKKPRDVFDSFKMHATTAGWEESIAQQIVSYLGRRGPCTTKKELFDRWTNEDSHSVIECHLPSFIPLSYVHKIIMPKNIYARISENTKKELDYIFPNFEEHVLQLTDTDQMNEKAKEQATMECVSLSDKYFHQGIWMKGFCFSVEAYTPTMVPFRISRENSFLKFRANGTSYFIYLTKCRDISVEHANSMTIYVNNEDELKGVYFFNGIVHEPLPLIKRKSYASICTHFNANLNPYKFISYEISIEKRKIRIYHTGHHYYINQSVLEADTNAGASFGRVHFRANRSIFQIADLQIQPAQSDIPKFDVPLIEADEKASPVKGGGVRSPARVSRPSSPANGAGSRPQVNIARPRTPADDARPNTQGNIARPRTPTDDARPNPQFHIARPRTPTDDARSSPSPKPACRDNLKCEIYHEKSHRAKFHHTLLPVCNFAEQCDKYNSPRDIHNDEFSHPCRFGIACRDYQKDDHAHNARYYHIRLNPCRYGSECRQIDEMKHCKEFSHPNPR
eukprot:TRINITY_DN6049_c0_g1_i2.p1 TRINITY_DN6049_c0_g1~~TRINITY_DN6049_c0_g1_i2.p1  ORF type:complete len:1967 (-),score=190.98 TRINITY_DN6049_c0_g1_i2:321-6221(-)